ncbi:DUF6227 family protein [Streptomyces albus]
MGDEAHLTPAHHVQELLARAQNPFDVRDEVLERLRSAVMCHVELHGWRHRNTPQPALRCSSFRHVFLLADGSSLPLWELCYDAPDATGELHEVYDDAEALRRSERRVHRRMGGSREPDRADARPLTPFDRPPGAAASRTTYTQEYADSDSAEHARRLLRRAENPDRPGEETLRLLSSSRSATTSCTYPNPAPTPVTARCGARSTSTPSCSPTAARSACTSWSTT